MQLFYKRKRHSVFLLDHALLFHNEAQRGLDRAEGEDRKHPGVSLFSVYNCRQGSHRPHHQTLLLLLLHWRFLWAGLHCAANNHVISIYRWECPPSPEALRPSGSSWFSVPDLDARLTSAVTFPDVCLFSDEAPLLKLMTWLKEICRDNFGNDNKLAETLHLLEQTWAN